MTQATLADFMARFPEFSCVDYTKINLALSEAGLFTDAGWGAFETLGSMLYTAHALASQGLGSGAASAALQNHGVKSRASGSHKIEYTDVGLSGFNSTLYGQQFAEILTRVSPGVLAVK